MNAGGKNNASMKTTSPSMTCAEFQDKLPELFESGADLKEQEHLKTCEQCSALVSDLEYIAQQAKLLLPIHDPARPCGRTFRPRSPRKSTTPTPARDQANERRPRGARVVIHLVAH